MIISTPFPPQEGIGYYTYNLSKKLIERGHEVTVITRGKFKPENFVYDGIKVYKARFLPIYPFHVQIHGIFLNKLFKGIENEFDLVHIHSPLTPIIKTCLPIISTMHGSVVGNAKGMDISDLKSWGNKLMTKYISYSLVLKLMRSSKIVTVVSNSVENEIKENYGIKDVIVAGNGVDEKKFFPLHKSEESYLLYVGRLSHGKGLFDLLNAFKKLDSNHNLKLYLAGSGQLETKLKKKIYEEHLENKVKLLGNLSHEKLVKIYQNAMIFVFPSHYEGLPTVLLEAMSCGLPVVVSKIPAHEEVIEDFEKGLFAEKGSPEDICDKINVLTNDESLRQKLGSNARKTIEDRFTWDKICDKFEDIYRATIQ